MKFENRFGVDAPIGDVWETMMDVERVAPCMPGAKVLDRPNEDEYKVGIRVKVGPVTMNYKGDVAVTDRDPENHRATMRVKAKEARGQGTANADVVMVLTGDGDHTDAVINTDVRLSGKAAAMGQGVISEVASNLVETFAENLEKMLAGEDQNGAAAAEGATAGEAGAGEKAEAGKEEPQPAPGGGGAAATAKEAAPGGGPSGGAQPEDEEEESALDAGQLVGKIVISRVQEPRTLLALLALVAAIAFALGRRSAR
jgi:carbon monoxide dehydrogenase subunit G